MDNKISTIIQGAAIIALGVLIAIFGGAAVADVYFGVAFLVMGLALLILGAISIGKKLPLPVGYVVLGAVLCTLAVALFAKQLTFGIFIQILVWVIMGVGVGLLLTGTYFLAKKKTLFGIGQLVIGALCILLSALYIAIPDFRTAFWIVVGIVIALYGLLVLIFALTDKKKK